MYPDNREVAFNVTINYVQCYAVYDSPVKLLKKTYYCKNFQEIFKKC